MFKILILILLIIEGFNSKATVMDRIIDQIGSQIVRVGDPDNLFMDNIISLEELCETYGGNVLRGEQDKLIRFFNGLTLELAKNILPLLSQDSRQSCLLLKQGEGEKVVKIAQKVNERVEEAQKVRLGFQTAVTECSKNNTKCTFPLLICYIREYSKNTNAIYEDNKEVKEMIQNFNQILFGKFIEILEKAKGKGDPVCQLPDASSNPSEFNSVIVPILKAIENLEKK